MKKLLAVLLISIITCEIIEKPKSSFWDKFHPILPDCFNQRGKLMQMQKLFEAREKIKKTKATSGNAAAVALCIQLNHSTNCQSFVDNIKI